MLTGTYLPVCVTLLFRGLPGMWNNRPRLLLGWLVGRQALYPGRKTLAERAHWPPAQVTAWRLRRMRQAAYWAIPLRVAGWVQDALNPLPPPKDRRLSLVGDGRDNPTRGTQHPLAQKGRKSAQHPGFFGLRFALVTAHWAGERLPVALRRMRPPSHPASHPDKALCGEMGAALTPPAWATPVMVEGAAASGFQAHSTMVPQRDAQEAARRGGCVCAMARPWETGAEKASKALVTYGPRPYAPRVRVPRLPGATGGTPFWVSRTRRCLRHLGAVTVVLSQRGRHSGPQRTQILVTNLDEWSPRQVVGA